MSLSLTPSLPRYGMDHARYDWAPLESRAAVRWPGGKPLALWINLSLEHFPLNPRGDGFKAPGNMTMPYPDLRHYTLRDYGNRVGVFRVSQASMTWSAYSLSAWPLSMTMKRSSSSSGSGRQVSGPLRVCCG